MVEMVPALGESITEGSIAKWIKSVGDKVNVDDVIAIVETDKVTVDIKSIRSGVLTKQLATDTVRAYRILKPKTKHIIITYIFNLGNCRSPII